MGALGNIVRQLHVHVVARRPGDAAGRRPVWGAGRPIPYTEQELMRVLSESALSPLGLGTGVASLGRTAEGRTRDRADNPSHVAATVLAALHNAAARTGSDFQLSVGNGDARIRASMPMRRQARRRPAACSSSPTNLARDREGARRRLRPCALCRCHPSDGGRPLHGGLLKSRQQIPGAAERPRRSHRSWPAKRRRTSAENLEGALCRKVSCGELYAAHFLGEAGARKLITAKDSDPSARADALFPRPRAPTATSSITRDGTPRRWREVYALGREYAERTQRRRSATADAPRACQLGHLNLASIGATARAKAMYAARPPQLRAHGCRRAAHRHRLFGAAAGAADR